MAALLQAGWRRVRGVVVVLAAVAITAPATVFASHQFSDVPSTHPFHEEIAAMGGAGITTGFADGTYRPSDPVNRQAMAAFIERSGGRLGRGTGGARLDGGEYVEVAQVTVEAGAARTGTGMVLLQGEAYAYATGSNIANCPCLVEFRLVDHTGSVQALNYGTVPGTATSAGYALGNVSITAVVPLPADVIRTYRLVAYGFESDAVGLQLSGSLTAAYAPFSTDGDQTEQFEYSCPGDDGFEHNDAATSPAHFYLHSGGFVRAIACPGDDDWYRLSRHVNAGDVLRVTAGFNVAEGNIDVCVLHPDGTSSTCSGSTASNETLEFTAPATGTYRVRVFLVTDAGTATGNTYSLTASRHAPSATADPSSGDAGPPPLGSASNASG